MHVFLVTLFKCIVCFHLLADYQKVFDCDRSSHVAREALMVGSCYVMQTVVQQMDSSACILGLHVTSQKS